MVFKFFQSKFYVCFYNEDKFEFSFNLNQNIKGDNSNIDDDDGNCLLKKKG